MEDIYMSTENKKMVANEQYQLTVEAVRIKGITDDGKLYDFIAFHTFDKYGKKSKIKFTKAVDKKLIPDSPGTYIVTVNKKDINRDKNNKYPVYWIKAITAITEYEGTSKDNEEDLPFDKLN